MANSYVHSFTGRIVGPVLWERPSCDARLQHQKTYKDHIDVSDSCHSLIWSDLAPATRWSRAGTGSSGGESVEQRQLDS